MNTYKCEICEGVFEKGWSDEEASAELGKNFPGHAEEDCGLVCDDCYEKMRAPLTLAEDLQRARMKAVGSRVSSAIQKAVHDAYLQYLLYGDLPKDSK